MQKKSIYVAYTGGTIGMQRSEHGYVPVSGHLQRQLALMPEFHRPEMPDFTIHEYHPLMDSSDMTPEDWQHIADDIRSHYEEYDGFVILHGTDTMAFTASALSFMLENLGKPVIVTGSQIPLAELRSDGQINLLNALYVAANYPINEVALFFNNRLYRGNRTTKAHADGFDAFASPNLAPLLEAGIHIRRLGTPPAPQGSGELIVHPITPQPIGVVTIYPGISADVVRNFLRQPVKALILRSYGVGNAPQNGEFIQVLAEASQRGIVAVSYTHLDVYKRQDWQHIADDIRSHYEEYDGFVILHGTDTMAFTASALSFMLENLGKPVIVTGSQIPLAELRSDGQINLLNALYVAANYPINEVALFFNNRLFRGNRTTKAHADGFDAFASPNLAPLLEAGIHIRRLGTPPAPQGSGELIVHPITPQPIGVVTIYPGISADVVRNFLRQPVKALILRSYGVGNAPQNGEFIQVLAEASQRGIVVVNLTQCMSGKVNMGGYATGNALAQAGVISGFDMTVEATLTKLHYLLSQQLDVDAIRAAMQQNLRGELTPDET